MAVMRGMELQGKEHHWTFINNIKHRENEKTLHLFHFNFTSSYTDFKLSLGSQGSLASLFITKASGVEGGNSAAKTLLSNEQQKNQGP